MIFMGDRRKTFKIGYFLVAVLVTFNKYAPRFRVPGQL
jgi:hypothetical protein